MTSSPPTRIWEACKNISDIQVFLVTNVFLFFFLGLSNLETSPIKLKLGLQVGTNTILIEQPSSKEPIKLSSQSEMKSGARFDCIYYTLFQSFFLEGYESASCKFMVPEEVLQRIHWIGLINFIQDFQCRSTYRVDWTDELHRRFPVQDHIMSGID